MFQLHLFFLVLEENYLQYLAVRMSVPDKYTAILVKFVSNKKNLINKTLVSKISQWNNCLKLHSSMLNSDSCLDIIVFYREGNNKPCPTDNIGSTLYYFLLISGKIKNLFHPKAK